MSVADLESRILARKWFYRFRLPSGAFTETHLPEDVASIHLTRERMLFQVLDPIFDGRWDDVTCVDLACHEGYFSNLLAEKGCRSILGIDERAEHIEHAELIRAVHDRKNLAFRAGNVDTIDPAKLGSFDVVLMYGLLYHLENPVGAIRLARALARRICLVETQVAPGLTGPIEWGSAQWTKNVAGSFAVIEEADSEHVQTVPGAMPVVLVPSLEALLYVMRCAGFSRVEVVTPPANAYEQFVRGKRVVVAGYVD